LQGPRPTASVRGFTLPSALPRWSAIQTPSGDAETDDGWVPTGIVSFGWFVVGSIRTRLPSVREAVGPLRARKKARSAAARTARPTAAASASQRLRRGLLSLRRAGGLDQLGAGLEPLGRILGERLRQHFLELAKRRRRLLQVGIQGRSVGAASERRLAREALVEQAAQRIDVCTSVDIATADLLGSDVIDRAEQARLGGVRFTHAVGQSEIGAIDMLYASRSTFEGLTSRWTSPRPWAKSSASATAR
jgi:hypothetical protein